MPLPPSSSSSVADLHLATLGAVRDRVFEHVVEHVSNALEIDADDRRRVAGQHLHR
jgi:hypothetical protein